jgi:GNAT superfamily N-acetyltransferase
MQHYTIRKGNTDNRLWLYELYCLTLRPAIERTWGWDNDFQFNLFSEHLKPENFEILLIGNKPIGGFYVIEKDDHFWLEMLLIHPSHQRKGIGKRILQRIQTTSSSKNKKIKLCIIKANPVRPFYEKLGFRVYDEDEVFYQMVWRRMPP